MRRVLLAAGAVAALAVAGGLALALSGGPGGGPTPIEALGNHVLLPAECVPVKGPRWVYPGPERVVSELYESFSRGYACADAAAWTRKLAARTVGVRSDGDPTTLDGPPGFTCSAWPDAADHAYAGACRRATSAVEFGWNWNVVNRRFALVPNIATPGTHLDQQLGTDAVSTLAAVGPGEYRLRVQNTSAMGSIDTFTWSPPTGWRITAVVSGAGCSLGSDGKVACRRELRPPSCLCTGSGGTVVVRFTAQRGDGTATTGTAGARLRITAMTPVPFLIPGTPAEAHHVPGL